MCSFCSDPVNVTQGLGNRTVNESFDLLVFRCVLTGFPEPEVTWTACNENACIQIEGSNVSSSNIASMGSANLFAIESNLTVESVLQNQKLYTCSGENNVTNTFGDDVASSSSGFLRVQGL